MNMMMIVLARAVRMDIYPPLRQIIDATIGLQGQIPTREKPETSQP